MEKLILERDENDYYKLEVNDKGEYIEFDLTDIGLPEKMMEATDKIRKIDAEYVENITSLTDNNELEPENKARQILSIKDKYFKEMTKTFDSFLGEGACNKIFGDKKCYGQYMKLLEALEPHFEKMHIKQEKGRKKLAEKYLNKDSDVL